MTRESTLLEEHGRRGGRTREEAEYSQSGVSRTICHGEAINTSSSEINGPTWGRMRVRKTSAGHLGVSRIVLR